MSSKKEQLKYFKAFIKKWNRGELDSSYYNEDLFDQRKTVRDQRTSYKWSLERKEADKEDMIGPTIDPNAQQKYYAPLPSDAMMSEEDQSAYQKNHRKNGTQEIPETPKRSH